MKNEIEKRIRDAFEVAELQVYDDSHKHAGHIDGNEIESHFRLTLVSNNFEGKSLLERQRMVYNLFAAEMHSGKIHMLTMNIKTPEEMGGK